MVPTFHVARATEWPMDLVFMSYPTPPPDLLTGPIIGVMLSPDEPTVKVYHALIHQPARQVAH